MPPIFPPRSNTFARASLVVLPLLLAAVAGLVVWWLHSPAFNKVGVAVGQPIPFPHGFHVSVVGLDCRYCHDSVEKSSFAGLPPTETCMSCHSQIKTDSPLLGPLRDSWNNNTPIQWNRVNSVPDFVYFDHHAHVNNGVGCESCHGNTATQTTAVKAETFYMAWCLDCHRDPEKFLRPQDKVYTMGYQPAGDQLEIGRQLAEEYDIPSEEYLMSCSTCHR